MVKRLPRQQIIPRGQKRRQWVKNIVLYSVVVLIALAALWSFALQQTRGEEIPLSQAIADIRAEKIEEIRVEEYKVILAYKDGKEAFTYKEPQQTISELFVDTNVDPSIVTYSVRDPAFNSFWTIIFNNLIFILPVVLILFFIFRQARDAGSHIFAFGKSRAKLFSKDNPKVRFSDVAGVDEAKKELEEVVDFLKHPQKYRAVGARTPKGVLLVGPAGVGKTLLARAVAGQAGVPFFSLAGSEFMEMFVGVGASVTGDTPVLIRKDGAVRLQPIGAFVDAYYAAGEEGVMKQAGNIETLGFVRKKTGFWGTKSEHGKAALFEKSQWQSIQGVYRHRVNEVYEVQYLGGVLRTTGDHSVFIRKHGCIRSARVDQLKPGDVLVSLPMNTRRWDKRQQTTVHELKAHIFPEKNPEIYLDFWGEDKALREQYEYALAQQDVLSQYQIAEQIGVSQATVGHWQNGIHEPQLLSRKLVKLDLPEKVKLTPELMKLFGLYTAEGRSGNGLQFVFGSHEKILHQECAALMKTVFGVKPKLEFTEDNSLRITYHSAHLGRFFERYCGTGSHNKHVPSFIWDLPRSYFLAYLKGYTDGDGYITKSGKLSACSVSQRLIQELAWLCSMHGIQAGIKYEYIKPGRVIKTRPLPESHAWTLIIGKTSNPFLPNPKGTPYQIKRQVIRKIIKKPYDGYVYDLCGVENEAFFGGEKPILLHNSRVRDLFNTAKKAAPSIIFIDEIESIGRTRGMGFSGGHDEREQTLNQILVEMDGFAPNENIVIISATNRPDLLDSALTRPGRFDRRVVLDLPDIDGRKAILDIHKKGKPFVASVDWEKVARRTVGFSGADLENMLNEAAIYAARQNRKMITFDDIEEAATKVKMGPKKKRLQSEEEKKMTAYHEGGHALVAHLQPGMDPVHRVSIVSRGVSLGHTMIPPKTDRYNETQSRLEKMITSLLGGRAAEELVFGDYSVGAASDLDKANAIARQMVTEYGMSKLGPIATGPQKDIGMWPREWFEGHQVSQDLAAKIDAEIRRIVDVGYVKARKLLGRHRKILDNIAAALIEKETLEAEEFEKLVGIPVKPAPAILKA